MKKFIGAIMAATLALSACVTVPAEAAPADFQLTDEKDGGVYDSNAHMGKPMVVEFYFNGCPACESNAPKVHALAQRFHGENAQVVEVGIDCDQSDYDDWLRRHRPFGPLLNGCNRELTRFFGVTAYPTTVVLDRSHNLAFKTVGTWNEATRRRIESYLSGAPE